MRVRSGFRVDGRKARNDLRASRRRALGKRTFADTPLRPYLRQEPCRCAQTALATLTPLRLRDGRRASLVAQHRFLLAAR
jgi:hypothetical protein